MLLTVSDSDGFPVLSPTPLWLLPEKFFSITEHLHIYVLPLVIVVLIFKPSFLFGIDWSIQNCYVGDEGEKKTQ